MEIKCVIIEPDSSERSKDKYISIFTLSKTRGKVCWLYSDNEQLVDSIEQGIELAEEYDLPILIKKKYEDFYRFNSREYAKALKELNKRGLS